MKVLLKVLRWILILVVLVLVLGGGGGYLWLRGGLPQIAGTVQVQGIAGQIEIVRDADAIPHIRARNEADALFGLGYVHAQDRLWQMEFQRRVGQGRLSELLGPATLEYDSLLRTLGIARAAASAWATLSPDARQQIEAYVAGVNAFVGSHHGRALPLEFSVLGFEPEPWRPEDVLVWAKMLAWNLGGNWGDELLRMRLNDKVGADRARQLMPAYAEDGPLILPSAAAAQKYGVAIDRPSAPNLQPTIIAAQIDHLLALDRFIQNRLGLGGDQVGSNNWVIGGARSISGKPLLANDPHLGAQIPSVWYLAHLSGGTLDVIGATLPGMPGVIIGHNRRIAWGVTNTTADVQDLYIEHVNDRNQAEYNGTLEPMRLITETVRIKGQPDVALQVRITRHGPLITDNRSLFQNTSETLAFRWTALDPQDRTLQSFLDIDRAGSWAEFTQALANYKTPMQNFVYADVNGNIGYYAPGALPIRAKGDGMLPVPGWTDEYEWGSYVSFENLPHSYNPPSGYIVSANNKVAPDSYPYPISSSWAPPYRAQRIIELIESKPKLSLDDMAVMQADVRSAQARELLPYLLQAKTDDQRARAAIELLRDWDGQISGASAQAAIYEAWYQQLPTRLFADDLGDDLMDQYNYQAGFQAGALARILKQNQNSWCDDTRTAPAEDCATIVGAALADGLAEMAPRQRNTDLAAWRWDQAHIAVFPHNLFGQDPRLKAFFDRRIPNGGDAATINAAPVMNFDRYNQYFGPSYRQIVDLSNLDGSRFMQPIGQSGHILSRNYSDLLDRWQRVEYLPMRFEAQSVDAAQQARLILMP